MEMAKASQRDMDMAIRLCSALESLERGFDPAPPRLSQVTDTEEVDPEAFDAHDDARCGRAMRHLLGILRGGSIGRVVWGMAVVLDPSNKLLDPAASTLERHPDLVDLKSLTADQAALIASNQVERLRQQVAELTADRESVRSVLHSVEAALSDIGDADREPGDDVAWCEQRAAEVLPELRSVL